MQSWFLRITYYGLIPFIVIWLCFVSHIGSPEFLFQLFTTYSATILCFIGGMHFGQSLYCTALSQSDRKKLLLISITPQTFAWFTLLISSYYERIFWLAPIYVLTLYIDRILHKAKSTTSWFYRARIKATVVAVIIHFLMVLYV